MLGVVVEAGSSGSSTGLQQRNIQRYLQSEESQKMERHRLQTVASQNEVTDQLQQRRGWVSHGRGVIGLRFVLRRPSSAMPWGVTVSLFEGKYLAIGYLKRHLVDVSTVFCAIVASIGPAAPVNGFLQRLQPGDVIISINGHSVSVFPSFEAISNYLRACNQVSLHVFRLVDLPPQNNDPRFSYCVAERSFMLMKPWLPALHGVQQGSHGGAAKFSQNPRVVPSNILQKPLTNPWFRDKGGEPISYDDDFGHGDLDDQGVQLFLPQTGVGSKIWLERRKRDWRQSWNRYYVTDDERGDDDDVRVAQKDFWSPQGFGTFDSWLEARTSAWRKSYSWNQKKRKQIQEEVEEVVCFPSLSLGTGDHAERLRKWISVRKNQWRLQRRKRQRKLEHSQHNQEPNASPFGSDEMTETRSFRADWKKTKWDMIHIDTLLEEEEKQRPQKRSQRPFDISFIFDARLNAPDDVISHCLLFLDRSEHWKLLCISASTNSTIKERANMWRQMCPTHWNLPRKPRKQWHDLYLSRIRAEEEASRKRSDDLVSSIASILAKGDQLQKVEKLVTRAETRFGFQVNYISAVVCERNSILNLAVINGRSKVAKWLVEEKRADLESCDRGNFTPLLNAAWRGDRSLVRFLLSKGANRAKVGTCHYSQALAAPDFEGMTADGYAEHRLVVLCFNVLTICFFVSGGLENGDMRTSLISSSWDFNDISTMSEGVMPPSPTATCSLWVLVVRFAEMAMTRMIPTPAGCLEISLELVW